MFESIYKNNELEYEVSLDISYFCYSDIDFFYHVKVITSGEDLSSCIIMRCNPIWNTPETMQSKQNQNQNQKQQEWFDWVEVDWDDKDGNVHTVPATLDLLYGVVRYCILTKALICLHQ